MFAVHCVAGANMVKSTFIGPFVLNTTSVGVCAVDILGVALGPKNQVKLPFAGKDKLLKLVIKPTQLLLDSKSAVGKVLIVIRLLTVSVQLTLPEFVPVTVKVTK